MKKLFLVSIAFLLTLSLAACDLLYVAVRKDIKSIAVDENQLDDFYYLDDFELSNIMLSLHLKDGSKETIQLTMAMVHEEDQFLLDTFGTHTIRIEFRGLHTFFRLTLYERIALST